MLELQSFFAEAFDVEQLWEAAFGLGAPELGKSARLGLRSILQLAQLDGCVRDSPFAEEEALVKPS